MPTGIDKLKEEQNQYRKETQELKMETKNNNKKMVN